MPGWWFFNPEEWGDWMERNRDEVKQHRAPTCESPEDVRLFAASVITYPTKAWIGPYSFDLAESVDINEALEYLEKKMQNDAFYYGANAVTNFECVIDWDKKSFQANGTLIVLKLNNPM